jgi:hypothetical protein
LLFISDVVSASIGEIGDNPRSKLFSLFRPWRHARGERLPAPMGRSHPMSIPQSLERRFYERGVRRGSAVAHQTELQHG